MNYRQTWIIGASKISWWGTHLPTIIVRVPVACSHAPAPPAIIRGCAELTGWVHVSCVGSKPQK
jgi:hypothetical protein